MKPQEKIRELIELLHFHDNLYNENRPVISDAEYDKLYFELQQLEQDTGIVYTDSPTQSIHYETVNSLSKVSHIHPMLSLGKTQKIADVEEYFSGHEFIAMAKLDGLSCSLVYEDGELVQGATRGNGDVGENITHNVLTLPSVPKHIAASGRMIVNGEVICKYPDFRKLQEEYSHPRNFASGSIRLLDANECRKRDLTFVAWDIVEGCPEETMGGRLDYCEHLGFEVVPHCYNKDVEAIINYIKRITDGIYPIDGVVFKFDDIEYGNSLGQTAHHPKHSIAFKYQEEEYETTVVDIEWSLGKTGQLTPIAILEPIEIDSTIVSRASLHNINTMRALGLEKIPATVSVVKAKEIIPQITSVIAEDEEAREIIIPLNCPVCGGRTKITISDSGTVELFCVNPECEGQFVNVVDHFASKTGLDIKGLSKATIEKLINQGWLNSIADIFTLEVHSKEWRQLPGFGTRSVENILEAIEAAKTCTLDKFLTSLGIPLIGVAQAKELCKHIPSYEDFREKINNKFDFSVYDGFATAKTNSLLSFDYTEADKVYAYLTCTNAATDETNDKLNDLKFVITGKVELFKNRNELATTIVDLGGHVVSKISKNTDYLINNDQNSTSTKSQAAKALGIPVLTEKEFIEKFDL